MRRDVRFALPLVVFTAVLACMPVASATSFADDFNQFRHIALSDDGAGATRVATCRETTLHRESNYMHSNGTNTLMPECLGSADAGTLSSVLWMLSHAGFSTTAMNGITTGLNSGIIAGLNTGIGSGVTAVVGSLCGTSATCLASSTPVSTTPEPGTLGLLGTGLLGLAGLTRRRFLPSKK